MRNYTIFGIGSALVDTEISVTEEFLQRHCLTKGVMSLVDETSQFEIFRSAIIEKVSMQQQSGGSVCNAVVTASHLGANCFFAGRVASDSEGSLFADDLAESNVDYIHSEKAIGVTGKCLVMVTPDADRTMATYLGISQQLSIVDVDLSALHRSEWLYIEGYMVTDSARADTALVVANAAREGAVKIALSLSDPFVATTYRSELAALMSQPIDLIFANRDEALAYTQQTDLDAAIAVLADCADLVVITDGARGAVVFDGNSVDVIDALVVDAVDTNGAGDTFAGAFLYSLTQERTPRESARFANYCAAAVVQQFGPRLDAFTLSSINNDFFKNTVVDELSD
jgi:sugar/nucleoside kinase (ribokinase family)